MADIINLRQARKQKKRKDKEAESSIRRVQFGRSKTEKEIVDLEQSRHERHLDAHKRDDDDGSDDKSD